MRTLSDVLDTSQEQVSQWLLELLGRAANDPALLLEALRGDKVLGVLLSKHLVARRDSFTSIDRLRASADRYECPVVLAAFLVCGLDWDIPLPSSCGLSCTALANVLKALLWRAKKSGISSLRDYSVWQRFVDAFTDWADRELDELTWRAFSLGNSTAKLSLETWKEIQFPQLIHPAPALPVPDYQCRGDIVFEQLAFAQNISPIGRPKDTHEWDQETVKRSTARGGITNSAWTGRQCAKCGALLVTRKATIRTTKRHLLGLAQCPGHWGNWISDYRSTVQERLAAGDWPNITLRELVAWGFIGDQ